MWLGALDVDTTTIFLEKNLLCREVCYVHLERLFQEPDHRPPSDHRLVLLLQVAAGLYR